MVFDICNIFFLCLIMFVCLYPFYYVLIYSLSATKEVAHGVYFWPTGFSLENYKAVFKLPGLLHAMLVSVLRTMSGSALTVFCCALFGYMLSKDTLPGKKIIYRFTVATMYISAGLIPWYLTMRAYHLSNNFLLYILPYAVQAYYVVLMKTFFEQLPNALEESAKIDGAGYLTVFLRIVLPLSAPIVATIFVFSAVFQWNSYFDNYIMVTDKNLQTLQNMLFTYLRKAEVITKDIDMLQMQANTVSPMSLKMTITTVTALPVLFIYPLAQRHFVKGIMIGAVKG